jgi:hypothetical protein
MVGATVPIASFPPGTPSTDQFSATAESPKPSTVALKSAPAPEALTVAEVGLIKTFGIAVNVIVSGADSHRRRGGYAGGRGEDRLRGSDWGYRSDGGVASSDFIDLPRHLLILRSGNRDADIHLT